MERQQQIAVREMRVENAADFGRIAFQHFEFENVLTPFEHARAGHFPAPLLDRFHRARKIVTKRLRLCYQAGDEHR